MREKEGKVTTSGCLLLKAANKRVRDAEDVAHANYKIYKYEDIHTMAEEGKPAWKSAKESMK